MKKTKEPEERNFLGAPGPEEKKEVAATPEEKPEAEKEAVKKPSPILYCFGRRKIEIGDKPPQEVLKELQAGKNNRAKPTPKN